MMSAETGTAMIRSFVRQFLFVGLVLLSACSRNVEVSTVLEDTGGLRPGDKVYLASREVGVVDKIQVTEEPQGFAVELGLYPEHAELIQANAVAYVPLKRRPMIRLLNPSESAAPVPAGGRLRGLSSLEATLWQASDAASAVSDLAGVFARDVESYFESDDWERTSDQFEGEVTELADDSRDAVKSIVEELRQLIDSLIGNVADGAQENETSRT